MDRRRPAEPPPTPPSRPPSSPFLHDISNYKTPLPHFRNPNPKPNPSPLFFTASKNTPSSSARPSIRRRGPLTPSLPHSKVARRLKALELEQSRSARKAVICKAKALKSFSRSVTAWLNFLFENPKECGCDVGMESDGGRGWKRQRNSEGEEVGLVLPAGRVSALRESLKDVCSLDDLRARMERYMSKKGCNEVLSILCRLCKNIDEGRLKMKAHCPIVTDLALKEKSTRVLMCYNPTWLRIGLHIVFGGDSLLSKGRKADQENMFLMMIIGNQFFTHMVIARSYAYNKLVEGLYRPGFFEALGSIILKRFLLFVLSLDKAKCESTLPLTSGIDGIDGGSPLLFNRNSHIKSTRQAVREFLSEAMHGEGDLISHLVILGCKFNYQQLPFSEYEFKVENLFDDLQDGIILSWAIRLLTSDASILSKMIVPSNSYKKRLQNCSTARRYLKQAGVSLSDADGIQITPEDIVNGDKELTLSILWNMFVHLQVPLLIDKALLAKEIAKLKGSDVVLTNYDGNTEVKLLLSWIKAVCERQHIEVVSFSSAIEGTTFFCLIDYYLRNDVCRYSLKYGEELLHDFDSVTTDVVHNFAFIQSVTAMLGNFPEVLQLSDMLDQDASFDERCIIILLVFLASRLICGKNLDDVKSKFSRQSYNKYTDLKSSIVTQTPIFRHTLFSNNPRPEQNQRRMSKLQSNADSHAHTGAKSADLQEWAASVIQSYFRGFTARKNFSRIKKETSLQEHAAIVIQSHFNGFIERNKFMKFQIAACQKGRATSIIQSHFRGLAERKKFLKIKMAACFVQTAVRAWLAVASKCKLRTVSLALSINRPSYGICDGYLRFMIERQRFIRIRKSVPVIQQAARAWLAEKHQKKDNAISESILYSDSITPVTVIQSFIRGQIVGLRYVDLVATVEKQQGTSPELEDHERLCSAAVKIQSAWKNFSMRSLHTQKRFAAIRIQSVWRGWFLRKNFLSRIAAIIKIQAGTRRFTSQKIFTQYRSAAIKIQRYARGHLTRIQHLGLCISATLLQSFVRGCNARSLSWKKKTIQRWQRNILLIKSRRKSVILIQAHVHGWNARRRVERDKHVIVVIQAHVCGWIARRRVQRNKHDIIVIQSYWKGYLVRKHSREQVAELRCRLHKSSVNVDDNKRLINRLVAALSELLGYKSVRNIRHTCGTLNTATELSQRCCETLVSAGAIGILLKQLYLLNRGIPDQEVLKHVVTTLRNISSYPQLLQVLIDTPQAVEIIFQELLRNKSDVFFVTYELLKRLCTSQDGLKAIRRLHGHIRKLNNLVHDLERKSKLERRNPRLCTGNDNTIRRLRAAADLLLLISDHQ